MKKEPTCINVIHIRSSGHGGSTLLNILLDRCDQVFAGAELYRYDRLWSRINTLATADGTLVKDSTFWNAVKNRLHDSDQLERYTDVNEVLDPDNVSNLLDSIIATSGLPIISDTSKSSLYSKYLYDIADQVLIVHLVRDGRAVARSMKSTGFEKFKFPFIWTLSNLRTWLKYRKKENYLQFSYEDIVFSTDSTLETIFDKANQQFDVPLSFSNNNKTAQHAFAGNRMRTGFTGEIKFDEAYLSELSVPYWWFLTITMLPALLCFKFALSRSAVRSRLAQLRQQQHR